MLKQFIALVVLSIVVAFFSPFFADLAQTIIHTHSWVIQTLKHVFTSGRIGTLIRDVLAFILMPVVVGGVVAFGYWLVKKHMMPNLAWVVWILWIAQAVAVLTVYG